MKKSTWNLSGLVVLSDRTIPRTASYATLIKRAVAFGYKVLVQCQIQLVDGSPQLVALVLPIMAHGFVFWMECASNLFESVQTHSEFSRNVGNKSPRTGQHK
jgi:hypothetical protein